VADTGGLRKRILATFTNLVALATGVLYLAQAGMWPFGILLYAIAVVDFSGIDTFYNSLLIIIALSKMRHRVFALGFALVYFGGGMLFLINLLMTLKVNCLAWQTQPQTSAGLSSPSRCGGQ
jgi:MFS transporter, UMF1 family